VEHHRDLDDVHVGFEHAADFGDDDRLGAGVSDVRHQLDLHAGHGCGNPDVSVLASGRDDRAHGDEDVRGGSKHRHGRSDAQPDMDARDSVKGDRRLLYVDLDPVAHQRSVTVRSATRIRLAVTLVAASLTLPAALAAPSASAADIGGFSVRPAEINPANPATRAYFVRSIRRGGSFAGRVVVSNASKRPIYLYVSGVDGLTGETSGAVYADRGDPRRAAGRWVQVATSYLRVPARSSTRVAFTVQVPRHTTAGAHLAGIAFQNARPTTTGGHFSITEVFRAVIGVEIQVPGRTSSRISLLGARLDALPGTNYPSVVVTVRNSGTRLCKPSLGVSLTGSSNSRHVRQQLDTVLPGSTIHYPLPWPRALRSGRYRIAASASGCGPRVSITVPAQLGTPLARTAKSDPASVAPIGSGGTPWWPIPLVGVGGLGLGMLAARLRRRPPTGS
jgi:hypothetical protein